MSSRAEQIVTFENKRGELRASLEEDRLREIINKGALNLPTIVISIGGVARSGKSFLLNLFVSYLSYIEQNGSDRGWESSSMPVEGVNWAQSRTAVTLGIWMWNRPFIITRCDGSKAAVLLVDSQGTGDNRRSDVKLDTLIMYISLQLSSVQVLNVEKYLTSDVMISLQLCADYADLGGVEQRGGGDNYLFQSLAFVIRDHQSDNHFGEDQNAFKDIVREVDNKELKKVVDGINNAFKNVTSFNMPYPGQSVVSASSSTKQWKVRDIPEEFLLASREIISKLCYLTRSESAGTSWDSGQELLANFNMLKYHLENDDLPQITSPMEALQETILYKAFATTQKQFSQDVIQMCDGDGLRRIESIEKLKQMFDRLVEKAKAYFKKVGRGDKYSRTTIWRKYEEMLITAFETSFSSIKVQFDFLQQVKKLEQANVQTKKQMDKQNAAFQQQVGSLTAEIDDTKRQQTESQQMYEAREASLQMEITDLHQKVAEAQNDEEKQRLREEIEAHRVESGKIRKEQEMAQQRSDDQMKRLMDQMNNMKLQQDKEQQRHQEETKRMQEEFQRQQERRQQQEAALANQKSGPSNWFSSLLGTAVPLIVNAAIMANPATSALGIAFKTGAATVASGVAGKIFGR